MEWTQESGGDGGVYYRSTCGRFEAVYDHAARGWRGLDGRGGVWSEVECLAWVKEWCEQRLMSAHAQS